MTSFRKKNLNYTNIHNFAYDIYILPKAKNKQTNEQKTDKTTKTSSRLIWVFLMLFYVHYSVMDDTEKMFENPRILHFAPTFVLFCFRFCIGINGSQYNSCTKPYFEWSMFVLLKEPIHPSSTNLE